MYEIRCNYQVLNNTVISFFEYKNVRALARNVLPHSKGRCTITGALSWHLEICLILSVRSIFLSIFLP